MKGTFYIYFIYIFLLDKIVIPVNIQFYRSIYLIDENSQKLLLQNFATSLLKQKKTVYES